MSLKPKQAEFVRAFKSGKYKYLCGAGTAGSGKSFLTIGLIHLLCGEIPGVRFAIGRKSEKNLKQTTIPTYNEIKRKTKSSNESVIVDMTARYTNGSEILFIWCDESKDPDLNNVKGLEVNGILFEEANQIFKGYFEAAKIRVGRWRPELCPAFIMLNLNPALGWVKDLFYDNWIAGTLPERYYFLEFDEQDAVEASGQEYVTGLADLAPQEHDRFVKNKWDYSDVPNQLISYEWYKQCIADEPVIIPGVRSLGATDPAWDGKDSTVFGRMHGNHIGWWEEYPQQDPDISGVLAWERIKMFGVKRGDWMVDPVGVGSATVLKLRNGFKYEPDLHYGSAPATNLYGVLETFNKRSEAHWMLGEAMRKQEITFTHHPQFQKQCLAITYYLDEKKIRILDKKLMKKALNNVSPGHVDVATMLIHKYLTTTSGLAMQIMDRQLNKKQETSTSRAQRERTAMIRQSRSME